MASEHRTHENGELRIGSHKSKAERERTHGIALGIAGIFVFGVLLGPAAIICARDAERQGVRSRLPRVLGWYAFVTHTIFVIALFAPMFIS